MNLTHLLWCQYNVFGNRRIFLFLFNFLGSTQVTVLIHSPTLTLAGTMLWAKGQTLRWTRQSCVHMVYSFVISIHRCCFTNSVTSTLKDRMLGLTKVGGCEFISCSALSCSTRTLSTTERNWLAWGYIACVGMGKTIVHSFQSSVLLPSLADFFNPYYQYSLYSTK